MRDSSPPEAVSATGPNGSPAFGRTRKTTSSAPVGAAARARAARRGTRPRPCRRRAARRRPRPRRARPPRRAPRAAPRRARRLPLGGGERPARPAPGRPVGERRQLGSAAARGQQLVVVPARKRRFASAIRSSPSSTCSRRSGSASSEARKPRRSQPTSRSRSADVAELLARARELGRQPLERRERALGAPASAAARRRPRARSPPPQPPRLDELGDVPQALALGAQRFLLSGSSPSVAVDERPKLLETRLAPAPRRASARRAAGAPPRARARRMRSSRRRRSCSSPANASSTSSWYEGRASRRCSNWPDIASSRSAARGEILARHRPTPRVRARAAVGEHAARERRVRPRPPAAAPRAPRARRRRRSPPGRSSSAST